MKARYLFPDDYMADLSVHVFNGRLYISPSHVHERDGSAVYSTRILLPGTMPQPASLSLGSILSSRVCASFI